MARPRKAPSTQARIAIFAQEELEVLVDKLHKEAHFETNGVTLLGSLVLAAARLPLDVLKALVPDYLAREQELLAKKPTDEPDQKL